jgi:hypothetical protein
MKNNERKFYVYAYLRRNDSKTGPRFSPYYIGKGFGRRAFVGRKRIAPMPADKAYICFIQENLTEEEALALEQYCITLYGRVDLDTGILRNLTNGGEGMSGFNVSVETRRRISIGNKGKKLSNEHKQKISAQLSLWQRGRKLPDHHKKNIARALEESLAVGPHRYVYELTSPEGESYVTASLCSFAKKYNLTASNLRKVIFGEREHHKGWTGKIVEQLR